MAFDRESGGTAFVAKADRVTFIEETSKVHGFCCSNGEMVLFTEAGRVVFVTETGGMIFDTETGGMVLVIGTKGAKGTPS